MLSPVDDKNKPLEKTEFNVYKKRAIFITVPELIICLLFKLLGLNNLFVIVVYSFDILSFMLITEK